jgi:hypothetical protein
MNVIPALGVYAALRREAGLDLPFPGGAPRVAQAIDADLLVRVIAWVGEAASAAGFTEVMDTEAMFAKYFLEFQTKRLLPSA